MKNTIISKKSQIVLGKKSSNIILDKKQKISFSRKANKEVFTSRFNSLSRF